MPIAQSSLLYQYKVEFRLKFQFTSRNNIVGYQEKASRDFSIDDVRLMNSQKYDAETCDKQIVSKSLYCKVETVRAKNISSFGANTRLQVSSS